jgi:hypothetical protein
MSNRDPYSDFFTLWRRVAPPSHSYLDKTCHAGLANFGVS